MAGKVALLVAGGTGGHLFPAEALAHELKARGWTIHLATDSRAEKFAANFPAEKIHVIPSATISGKNPVTVAKAILTLWKGYLASRSLIGALKPSLVARSEIRRASTVSFVTGASRSAARCCLRTWT